jgi:hypothetical protein
VADLKREIEVVVKAIDQATSVFKQVDQKLDESASKTKSQGDAAKDAGSSWSGMSNAIKIATAAVSTFLAAVGVNKLIAIVDQQTKLNAAYYDMAKITGMTTEALSQQRYMAEMVGSSLDTFTVTLRFLSKNLGEATGGSKKAEDSFTALGLSAKALRELSPEVAFEKVVEALAKMPSHFDKVQSAVAIFGRGGTDALRYADRIVQLRKEAEALATVTETEVHAFHDSEMAMKRAGEMTDAMKRTISVGLAPVLAELKESWAELWLQVVAPDKWARLAQMRISQERDAAHPPKPPTKHKVYATVDGAVVDVGEVEISNAFTDWTDDKRVGELTKKQSWFLPEQGDFTPTLFAGGRAAPEPSPDEWSQNPPKPGYNAYLADMAAEQRAADALIAKARELHVEVEEMNWTAKDGWKLVKRDDADILSDVQSVLKDTAKNAHETADYLKEIDAISAAELSGGEIPRATGEFGSQYAKESGQFDQSERTREVQIYLRTGKMVVDMQKEYNEKLDRFHDGLAKLPPASVADRMQSAYDALKAYYDSHALLATTDADKTNLRQIGELMDEIAKSQGQAADNAERWRRANQPTLAERKEKMSRDEKANDAETVAWAQMHPGLAVASALERGIGAVAQTMSLLGKGTEKWVNTLQKALLIMQTISAIGEAVSFIKLVAGAVGLAKDLPADGGKAAAISGVGYIAPLSLAVSRAGGTQFNFNIARPVGRLDGLDMGAAAYASQSEYARRFLS